MAESAYGDLLVVDLGAGMAAALVAKFLAESGARIVRIEPATRDPFYDVYPAYEVWRRGAAIEKAADDPSRLKRLLAEADVCLVGGEDYPGLERRTDIADLAAQNPRLVILDILGYPAGAPGAGRAACDILVQARSGLAYEHFSDRPLLMSFEPANYGAALQGLAGLFAALYERELSGRGQIVSTSLHQGALTWMASFWTDMEKPTQASSFVMPLDPWPLVFQCADGRYLHIVLGSTGSKGRLYRILEIDDPTVDINDSGMPRPTADTKNFFGDIDLLAAYIRKRDSHELLHAMWDAGMAAEPVLAPGECWDQAQVLHNEIIVRDADGVRHVGHPLKATLSPAPRRPRSPPGSGPLAGLTALDFGAYVAGPYCSVILGDLGADVIKIEPVTGDPNRAVFRSFTSVNRGKRSIALDLKAPEGREIAQRLCARADVVTNNFRTGVSARLGVDAEALHRLKPDLLVLESAAYGSSGPQSDRAGFDMVFQALCGHEYRAGGVGNAPLWNRTSMVDYAGGLLGAISVLEFLFVRARTGAGAALNVALMNAGLFLLSDVIQTADGRFIGAPPVNHERTGYHPAEQIYQAADGWIAIAARGDTMAQQLAETLGLDALAAKPRSAWNSDDAQSIADEVRRYDLLDISDKLEAAGVWAEPCRKNTGRETLYDPSLVADGTIHCSTHREFGDMRELGPLFRLSRSRCAATGHTATRGEHTREILGELGYGTAEIDTLYAGKLVR